MKVRLSAEEQNRFLVKESRRELMLAEEAKKLLSKKSEEADRAREAKARKDWQELQEKESAEGTPEGAPAFRYRSIKADNSREMLETIGNLRDWLNEAPLERHNWFYSDLCILEPTNSMQLAAFEQLRLTGLLCSRFSTSVRKGRRFFTLAGEDTELQNGQEDKRRDASRQRRQQQPASPAVSVPDGGSRAGSDVAADPLAVLGSSGVSVRHEKEPPSVPAEESAAVEPAGEPAAAVPAVESAAAVEPAGEPATAVPAVESVAAEEPAVVQGRPVLVDEPAAAQGESWIMNPAISPKVIVNMTREGPVVKAAAEAAIPQEKQSGESLPGLKGSSAARQAAAVQGKRKACVGRSGGSQKRKRSSPAGLKDLS